jgi:hypothetical protein
VVEAQSDDSLAALDLRELFEAGISDEAGTIRPELQGHGAVAAAVQLERRGVGIAEVTSAIERIRELLAGRTPEPVPTPPFLRELVTWGLDAGRDEDDHQLFVRWLGQVLSLLVVRARVGTA